MEKTFNFDIEKNKNGIYVKIYENGNIKSIKRYKNGYLHGKSIKFNKNGVVYSIENFNMGIYHGEQLFVNNASDIVNEILYNDGHPIIQQNSKISGELCWTKYYDKNDCDFFESENYCNKIHLNDNKNNGLRSKY